MDARVLLAFGAGVLATVVYQRWRAAGGVFPKLVNGKK